MIHECSCENSQIIEVSHRLICNECKEIFTEKQEKEEEHQIESA